MPKQRVLSGFINGDIEDRIYEILCLLGEDVTRPGLQDTPLRVAKMFKEITAGLKVSEKQISKLITDAIQKDGGDGMVIVKDIPFNSICEHHLVSFAGTCSFGYIPLDGRVVGLSKFARVLDIYAMRPQVQERLTQQVADAFFYNPKLKPEGVGVVIKAEHNCMSTRGVKKHGTVTITSEVRGSFKDEVETRNEWLKLGVN